MLKKEREREKTKGRHTRQPFIRAFDPLIPLHLGRSSNAVKSLIPCLSRDGAYLLERVARSSRGCNIISSESRVKGCYYAYPMAGRSSYVSRAFRGRQKRCSIAFLDKSWLPDSPRAGCPSVAIEISRIYVHPDSMQIDAVIFVGGFNRCT